MRIRVIRYAVPYYTKATRPEPYYDHVHECAKIVGSEDGLHLLDADDQPVMTLNTLDVFSGRIEFSVEG
jgi:hypothetical protein